MSFRSRAAAAALLLAGGMTALAQEPTFRSDTRTVALYATVTDDKKRLIPDLTQQDFEIFVAEGARFRQPDAPLRRGGRQHGSPA